MHKMLCRYTQTAIVCRTILKKSCILIMFNSYVNTFMYQKILLNTPLYMYYSCFFFSQYQLLGLFSKFTKYNLNLIGQTAFVCHVTGLAV